MKRCIVLPLRILTLLGLIAACPSCYRMITLEDEWDDGESTRDGDTRVTSHIDPGTPVERCTSGSTRWCSGQDGWWRGQGFGNSIQKYDYLPEAHTDFIFPILGEELGLIAALIVVLLYLVLFALGLAIAFRARDDFGRLIAFGITLMISVQALINFAVVTGCVPTKGLALPFISYGGSSLLVSGVMIGILINIAHSSMHAPSRSSRSLFKDRLRKV